MAIKQMRSLFIFLSLWVAIFSLSHKEAAESNQDHQQYFSKVRAHMLRQHELSEVQHSFLDNESNDHKGQLHYEVNQLNGCSQKQNKTIIEAINKCDQQDIVKTSACIDQYIRKNINEMWSVLVVQKDKDQGAKVVPIFPCFYAYQQYGKFNRTFNLWTTEDYDNYRLYLERVYPKKLKLNQEGCDKNKLKQIKGQVKICIQQQILLPPRADCINKRLKEKYNEEWNAILLTQDFYTKKWNSFASYYTLKSCKIDYWENLVYYRLFETVPKQY